MSKRIISGVMGALFAFAVLIFNERYPMIINIMVTLISILAISEIFSVMGVSSIFWITIPTSIFVSIMPMFGNGFIWQIGWFLYTLIIFSLLIFNHTLRLKDITTVYAISILLTFSLSKLVEIRDFGGRYGSFYVLLAMGVAWMSDTGAYFIGKKWGKNKLCPRVSPKKTIEGAIGGVIVCTASLAFIGLIFNNFIFVEKIRMNYMELIFLGLLGSPISIVGDLCFSVIKRNCHVKDFGNVIPGHGGVLDRFDSLIFVAPYVYLFINFFGIVS